MMYLFKHRAPGIALGVLLIFSACKKNADSDSGPLTGPLPLPDIKAGDTLLLKGKNFSPVTSENSVRFSNTAASFYGTVVSAGDTALKVFMPILINQDGTYKITVTVNGKKAE